MKRIVALFLSVIIVLGISACSEQKGHEICIRDEFFSEKISVTFLSSKTNKTEKIDFEYTRDSNDDSEYVDHYCKADTDKYDRMYFEYDGQKSSLLAFNDYVSGWEITSYGILPLGATEAGDYETEIKTFKYGDTTKDIYIWKPDDKVSASKGKYSVIYMTDGQNLFNKTATSTGCWNVADSVVNMMKNSDNKAIIVGIDDGTSNRDSELTPDIGDVEKDSQATFENGTGEYFSDFVYETVVPYIEKNYDVYTDAEHNAICGSSSGGIESFYIGMEHPDKFGTIGALSPAFGIYDDDTWVEYLKSKKFDKNYPFVYIYNGDADDLEKWLKEGAESMPDNLDEIDYPKKKIKLSIYKNAQHNESYWRAVFPEFLDVMFN